MNNSSELPAEALQWLRSRDCEVYDVEKLAGDASTRLFFRLHHSSGSSILSEDPSLKNKTYPLLPLYDVLRPAGFPIPEIYFHSRDKGYLVMQDCGDIPLQKYIQDSPDKGLALLSESLDLLKTLQRLDFSAIPGNRALDRWRCMYEIEFFIHHTLVCRYGYDGASDEVDEIRREWRRLCRYIHEESTFVPAHRDYHSRNIMIHKERPFVIDYQDLMPGPRDYDAASLIFDPYMDIPLSSRFDLTEKWLRYSNGNSDLFYMVVLQRHLKAMGSYGYLGGTKGKGTYMRALDSTLRLMEAYSPVLQMEKGIIKKILSIMKKADSVLTK